MRIDFGEPIEFEIPVADFPLESIPLKSLVNHAEKKIFVLKSAYDEMIEHVNIDKDIECGGILVGYPFQDGDSEEVFVVIVGVIRDLSDNRSVVHFTVTPEVISKTRKILEEKYPKLIAVGWYHSHPGHGVFLSGQDMTIVRGIYNEEWNLAWVIDPIRQQEGIFYGADGEPIVKNKSSNPLFSSSKQTWISLDEYPQCIKDLQQEKLKIADKKIESQPSNITTNPPVKSRLGAKESKRKEKSKESGKNKRFGISVTHPKLLSKRFESVFLLHFFVPEQRSQVVQNIKSEYREQKTNEQLQQSSIKIGQKITVNLFSPVFHFSESVTKLISEPVNRITFLGMPNDYCEAGLHKVLISISDADTGQEFESFAIIVKVVDFAFDHISRPLLSKVSTIVLGISSFVMFILTFLEQIDKTIGLTSGTAAGVLAVGIYSSFYNLYQRVRQNTP